MSYGFGGETVNGGLMDCGGSWDEREFSRTALCGKVQVLEEWFAKMALKGWSAFEIILFWYGFFFPFHFGLSSEHMDVAQKYLLMIFFSSFSHIILNDYFGGFPPRERPSILIIFSFLLLLLLPPPHPIHST